MPDSNRAKHCRLFYTLEKKQASSSDGRESCTQSRCKTLVDKVSGTLEVMEMQTFGKTLVEVQAKDLVDLLFKIREETLTQV